MEINRAAFGALAVFGVVAAGGGAYLANRHNDVGNAAGADCIQRRDGERGDRNRKQHHDRAGGGRRDRAGRCRRNRHPRLRGRAHVARGAGACAHDAACIAARADVVDVRRERIVSGADVHAVGRRGRFTGLGGGRAAGKYDGRTRSRSPRNRRGSSTTSW